MGTVPSVDRGSITGAWAVRGRRLRAVLATVIRRITSIGRLVRDSIRTWQEVSSR